MLQNLISAYWWIPPLIGNAGLLLLVIYVAMDVSNERELEVERKTIKPKRGHSFWDAIGGAIAYAFEVWRF